MPKKDNKFPIRNNVKYRQVRWLSLSALADYMGEFTKDDTKNPVWEFFFWLDNKSTAVKDTNKSEKYITFEELPPMAKTRRWYVNDKAGQPFALIKWYGGWRKYVCYFQQDSWCDPDCLRLIADFCEGKTKEHYAQIKAQK